MANAGTIEAIDGTHIAVTLDGKHPKTINFDAASFDQFRHGYAGTIYRGQGRTLDQTYLYHSEHWRSAASYVALTRHRDKAELFVARNTAADITQLGPANGAHRRPARGLDVPPSAGHRPGTADDRARSAGALRRRELPPAAG